MPDGLLRLVYDVPLDRALHQLATISEQELFLDMGLVRLDGFDAEVKLIGDLACSVPFTDQAEDSQFAIRQIGDGRTLLLRRSTHEQMQHLVRHPFAQINFAAEDSPDG